MGLPESSLARAEISESSPMQEAFIFAMLQPRQIYQRHASTLALGSCKKR